MSAKSTAGKELLEDLSKCTGTLEELDNVIAYLDSDPWKPSSMMTADESKVVDQQEVVLGEELHSMQYVGIDTDSSRGASTVKADFLYIHELVQGCNRREVTARSRWRDCSMRGSRTDGSGYHCRRRDRRRRFVD